MVVIVVTSCEVEYYRCPKQIHQREGQRFRPFVDSQFGVFWVDLNSHAGRLVSSMLTDCLPAYCGEHFVRRELVVRH